MVDQKLSRGCVQTPRTSKVSNLCWLICGVCWKTNANIKVYSSFNFPPFSLTFCLHRHVGFVKDVLVPWALSDLCCTCILTSVNLGYLLELSKPAMAISAPRAPCLTPSSPVVVLLSANYSCKPLALLVYLPLCHLLCYIVVS